MSVCVSEQTPLERRAGTIPKRSDASEGSAKRHALRGP